MDTHGARARYVLGVNPGLHDASASLLRNGELVAMIEQERLSRRRYSFFEPPSEAIAACLAHEGINLDAVAEIAVGWNIPKLMELEGETLHSDGFAKWLLGSVTPAGPLPSVRFIDHHVAHAASAFYTSGFTEAAILVVDGKGESSSTSIAVGGPDGIEVIKTWGPDQSLGLLYGWAAEWAGLTPQGAGKLMGLAAYGKACQPVPLSASPDGYSIAGAHGLDLGAPISPQLMQLRAEMQAGFARRNYPFGRGDATAAMAHANFAASIQDALTNAILSLATLTQRLTGQPNLVMAGGVALNCTANGALSRAGIFDDIWIPPFPFDSGVGIGAALLCECASNRQAKAPERLSHAFWAPDAEGADSNELLSRLPGCDVSRHSDDELPEIVARRLTEGGLIGWWQGRAEVGQRALGARSILCDPRKHETLVRLNRVKGREPWRPLAPAVPADQANAVFEGPLPPTTDFMLAALPVREQARPRLPAAVHVDGSARPQVVRPEQSRYYRTIHAFYEHTGVPAIINTSFNLAGEPIVHSAADAIDAFLRSDLDMLVLGDLVASRPTAEKAPAKKSHRVRAPSVNSRFPAPWRVGSQS